MHLYVEVMSFLVTNDYTDTRISPFMNQLILQV